MRGIRCRADWYNTREDAFERIALGAKRVLHPMIGMLDAGEVAELEKFDGDGVHAARVNSCSKALDELATMTATFVQPTPKEGSTRYRNVPFYVRTLIADVRKGAENGKLRSLRMHDDITDLTVKLADMVKTHFSRDTLTRDDAEFWEVCSDHTGPSPSKRRKTTTPE